MFAAYTFEERSRWTILVFAGACVATAIYSALEAIYPIMVVEALWAGVALKRFTVRSAAEAGTEGGEP
ncbi:MAG: hypothetical protein IIA59_01790 [Candidatus Marinimicrobia bacterium]|nr:hypothetical protein [Candidatus Neomarinimicrobiota bacterium]